MELQSVAAMGAQQVYFEPEQDGRCSFTPERKEVFGIVSREYISPHSACAAASIIQTSLLPVRESWTTWSRSHADLRSLWLG